MTASPTLPISIEVGGVTYTRAESERLREELIHMRARAMDQLPEAAQVVVLLTHTIGWMYEVINAGVLKEPR